MAKQKTDLPASKRFKIWFRKNEKIFWGVLLVLVTLAFGITGTMTFFFTNLGRNKPIFICNGRGYSYTDYTKLATKLNLIRSYNPALDYSNMITPMNQYYRQGPDKSEYEQITLFLAAAEEAKELNIPVSSEQIGEMVKATYKSAKARDAFRKLPVSQRPDTRAEQSQKLQELMDGVSWSLDGYRSWLGRNNLSINEFEHYIRMLIRVQKLLRFYVNQDILSKKDIYDHFIKKNRKLTLDFTRVTAEDFLGEVTEEYTEKELKSFYDSNIQKFIRNDRIRFSCMLLPVDHFEKQTVVTPEELKKEYERNKSRNYLKNPLEIQPAYEFPLTPEEQEEYNRYAYIPFEEVKEEIEETVRRRKVRQAVTNFSNTIYQELNKKADAGTDNAAEEKDAEPATAKEIAAKYDFVEYREVDFFTEKNAEKELGSLYSENQVKRWFTTLKDDPAKLKPSRYPLPDNEEKFYYLVTSLEGGAQKQLTFEEGMEKAKRLKALDKAAELAQTEAENLIVQVREDKKLAELVDKTKVHRSPQLEQGKQADTEILVDGEPIPQMIKSRVFFAFFGSLDVDRKTTETPLEYIDPSTGETAYYVFTIAEEEPPAPALFTEQKQAEIKNTILSRQMQQYIFSDWSAHLASLQNSYIEFIVLPSEENKEGKKRA